MAAAARPATHAEARVRDLRLRRESKMDNSRPSSCEGRAMATAAQPMAGDACMVRAISSKWPA